MGMALVKRFILGILVTSLLAGCLVPDRYTATLTVSNNRYSLEFIGEMHVALLYTDDYKNGSLSFSKNPQTLPEQVRSEFRRVILERQNAKIELRDIRPELFQTAFQYTSPYIYPEASGLFHFTIEKDILTITSRSLSPEDKKLLHANALTSKGTLRIKVFGTVLESNADILPTITHNYYTWNRDSIDEGVRMVIRFASPIHP